MKFPRRSGILLHPTSLPGRYGIGDLGPMAYRFVDWLHEARQHLWQVLPLGQTGYGDSPYQSFSAFAGNPLLISPERLVEEKLLDRSLLDDAPDFPPNRVPYGEVIVWKNRIFRTAFQTFRGQDRSAFDRWEVSQRAWLDDYALFVALKDHFGGGPWKDWPQALRVRDKVTLASYRERLSEEIEYQKFLQFQFFQQWRLLRGYAHGQGVAIVGDIPIFIAHDSADAWSQRELFYINEDGSLQVQAGVPPDYFSESGQLWGNPLYRWEVLQDQGYSWWIERFRAILNLVDMVRVDHFRGFEASWTIPGGAQTAVTGQWREAPGSELFQTVRNELGELPIIAENLGVITPEVETLRNQFQFPGMRLLQFAFSADTSPDFLPHNFTQNTVAYTGTHDNDTTRGWFDNLNEEAKVRVLAYFDTTEAKVVRSMVRAVIASVADTAIVPMQDVLELGTEARMNLPGRPSENWQWRLLPEQLREMDAAWLASFSELYERG